MDLNDYLNKRGRGSVVALARLIGSTHVEVSQWRYGVRKVPAHRCPDIERATRGEVRCEDLRPDIGWGHLRQGEPVAG